MYGNSSRTPLKTSLSNWYIRQKVAATNDESLLVPVYILGSPKYDPEGKTQRTLFSFGESI